MTRPMITCVQTLIRAWVRLYTWGVPDAARNARADEIESDLWEHQRYAESCGSGTLETAGALVERLICGVPADLSWRATYIRARSSSPNVIQPKKVRWKHMTAAVDVTAFRGIAGLVAVLFAALAIQNFVGAGSGPQDILAGGVIALLAVVIGSGVWLSRRSMVIGGGLVLLAIVPVSLAMYWTVVLPLLALVLVILWVRGLRNRQTHA